MPSENTPWLTLRDIIRKQVETELGDHYPPGSIPLSARKSVDRPPRGRRRDPADEGLRLLTLVVDLFHRAGPDYERVVHDVLVVKTRALRIYHSSTQDQTPRGPKRR